MREVLELLPLAVSTAGLVIAYERGHSEASAAAYNASSYMKLLAGNPDELEQLLEGEGLRGQIDPGPLAWTG